MRLRAENRAGTRRAAVLRGRLVRSRRRPGVARRRPERRRQIEPAARHRGFLPFSEGAASLEGGDPEQSLPEQAHYLGHADGLKGALTAGENLEFLAGALGGDSRREAWLAALDRLGLAHVADFPVRALSAGQKRRVALARLAVARRPLWLLDEPTTALDVAAQALFAGVMREHLNSGGLIIAATHAPLGLEDGLTLRLGPAAAVAA